MLKHIIVFLFKLLANRPKVHEQKIIVAVVIIDNKQQ